MELLKHYMDDGFIFWPLKLNFENFKTCSINMQPTIKFTFEKQHIIYENEKKVRVLNFLDVKMILHKDLLVETGIYYKPTNNHDYLPYDSANPDCTKSNIPYNLPKRIIVFVFSLVRVIIRLAELRF